MSADFSVVIQNLGDAPVAHNKTMTENAGPNFRLRMWFADSDSLTSQYNYTVWTSEFNLTISAMGNYTIETNATFGFSADICFHLKYQCILLEPVNDLVYKDLNPINNFACVIPDFNIVCQPGN